MNVLACALSSSRCYPRQRSGHYFGVLPFVLTNFLLGVPLMALEVIVFPTIIYWMGNLRPEPGAYFFLLAQCFSIR